MGKLFFNILATFTEFEADLIRHRTGEGMAIARSKGKLRGKQPKLSANGVLPKVRRQQELARIHESGEYSISDLAELFPFHGQRSTERSPGRRMKPLFKVPSSDAEKVPLIASIHFGPQDKVSQGFSSISS